MHSINFDLSNSLYEKKYNEKVFKKNSIHIYDNILKSIY